MEAAITDDRGAQLALPLDGVRRLFVVSADDLHGRTLMSLLAQVHPRQIIDLRNFPRLDFTGITADDFRRMLLTLRTSYWKAGISLQEIESQSLRFDLNDLCSNIIQQMRDRDSNIIGPYMFFVQSSRQQNLIGPYLNSALATASGQQWQWQRNLPVSNNA